MRLVTLIHTQRWHAYRGTAGNGHLYQGRFKSFVVQTDLHFLAVCRYVEANALRAHLVDRAEDWRWSSLWRKERGKENEAPQIDPWPLPRPPDWAVRVNEPIAQAEVEVVRSCSKRGAPYGEGVWVKTIASKLGLECSLRPRGRPKKRVLTPFSAVS